MSSDSDDLEFRINTKFAQNYNKWRRKEELQKLKDRYGEDFEEDSSSSSEEEDDDAEGLTPQIEKDFLKTLSYVKSRNPKIYNKEETFYHEQGSSSSDDASPATKKRRASKKSKEDKPVFLKDYERQIITEKGGQYSDEYEDQEDEDEDLFERAASPTYVQEQEMIKQSFQTALQSSDSDSSEDDTLLTKKRKTAKQQKKEEEEYLQWMKGQKEELSDEAVAQDAAEMDALRKYWTDPSLEEGERFLRDFILNKGYKDKEEDQEVELEEADFSEEERLLDAQDNFERKYNFRYEEPDAEFIKRYPRTLASSVRVKDNKRAAKRQERKERKIEEKERKKEDLKQLKNLKKQEILDKLEKLRQVTGNATVGFDDMDLEGDFDPEKHDQDMKKIFNDEYDNLAAEDTKPEFEREDWEEEDWDNWDGQDYEDEDYYEGEDDETNCEDADFNMDADYDPSLSKQANKARKAAFQQELIDSSSKKKKKKKQSKFAEALKTKKPVFDPADKTFEEYVEEFYKLDYEDMIDDIPCRFKYRKVVPNDFGLTTEEILTAKERELNQWASLKKTCQFRTEEEEEMDRRFFAKKAKNEAKKRRIFLSLLDKQSESESSEEEGTRKRQKTSNSTSNSQSTTSKTKKPRQRPPKKKNAVDVSQASAPEGKSRPTTINSSQATSDSSKHIPKPLPRQSPQPETPSQDTTARTDTKKRKRRRKSSSGADHEPKPSKEPDNDNQALTSKPNSASSQDSTVTKTPSKEVKSSKTNPNQNKNVAGPTNSQKITSKTEIKDSDKESMQMQQHKENLRNETDIDHPISVDAHKERTSLGNVPKKRKRKRKRSRSEGHPTEKATDSSETFNKTGGAEIKNASLKGDATSATQNSAKAKIAVLEKKKSGQNQTDPSQRNTDPSKDKTHSKESSVVKENGGSNLESLLKTDSLAANVDAMTGSKKRRRKRKKSNSTAVPNPSKDQSITAPSTNKETDMSKSSPADSPGPATPGKLNFPAIKQKLKKQQVPSASTKSSPTSAKPILTSREAPNIPPKKKDPSTPVSKKPNETKTGTPQQSSAKSRTRAKNRNRRLAKLGEKKALVEKKSGPAVSDARLKAYGINPKKHGYRMKFLREQEAKKHQQTNQGS